MWSIAACGTLSREVGGISNTTIGLTLFTNHVMDRGPQIRYAVGRFQFAHPVKRTCCRKTLRKGCLPGYIDLTRDSPSEVTPMRRNTHNTLSITTAIPVDALVLTFAVAGVPVSPFSY